MKKDFTGWYETKLYDLYVEGGRVVRGKTKGWDTKPVYPYKRNPRGGWDQGSPTLDTYKRSDAWQMM